MLDKKKRKLYQNEKGQALLITIGIGVVVGIISYILQMSLIQAEKNLWLPRLINENSKFENQLTARAGHIFYNPYCWKMSTDLNKGFQLDLDSVNKKCIQNETKSALEQIQVVLGELNSEYESQRVFYNISSRISGSENKDASLFSLHRYEFSNQKDFDDARLRPDAVFLAKADVYTTKLKISYPQKTAEIINSYSSANGPSRGCPINKPIWLDEEEEKVEGKKVDKCVALPSCEGNPAGAIMSGYNENFEPICTQIPNRTISCASDEYMSLFEWNGNMNEAPVATCLKRPDAFDYFNRYPVTISESLLDIPDPEPQPNLPVEPTQRRVKKYCENSVSVYSFKGCQNLGRFNPLSCPCTVVFQGLLQKLIEKEPSLDFRSNLDRLVTDSQCSNTDDLPLTIVDFGELSGSVWSLNSSVERSTRTINNGPRRQPSLEVTYKAELCINKLENVRP